MASLSVLVSVFLLVFLAFSQVLFSSRVLVFSLDPQRLPVFQVPVLPVEVQVPALEPVLLRIPGL